MSELDELRAEHQALMGEYTKLRDRQHARLVDERKRDERVHEMALAGARGRALDFATGALAGLRDPLRRLATQLAPAGDYSHLAQRARDLLRELDREPAEGSAERLLADVRAELERVKDERRAMWAVLVQHGLCGEIGQVKP